MKKLILALSLVISGASIAQKKPLDHTVYDSWESIGEKLISANGKFVVYTINLQEGDGRLIIQETNGNIIQTIARGYNAAISDDDKFVVFKIKPTYKETRDARIAKKKADDLPKDSLGIFNIEKNKLDKIERVKSYKMPEKAGGWVAYLLEKAMPPTETAVNVKLDSTTFKKNIEERIAYSTKMLDSLQKTLAALQENGFASVEPKKDTTSKRNVTAKKEEDILEGTDLVLFNLVTGKKQIIKLAQEYLFSKNGEELFVETTKKNKSNTKSLGIIYHLGTEVAYKNSQDTLAKNFIDIKQMAFADDAKSFAFSITYDTSKNEQLDYKVVLAKIASEPNQQDNKTQYLFKLHKPSIDISNSKYSYRINENSPLSFSKSGERLFFGTSPFLPIKDTSLPEFERVSVDVWNYKDEDLMTVQLKQADARLRRGFTAMYDDVKAEATQLGNDNFRIIRTTQEGDGKYFFTESDSGYRVAAQWQGFTYKDVFAINTLSGETKKIATKVRASIYPSFTGKYLLMYDEEKKQYSCYNAENSTTAVVAKDIPYALYDEENDMPDAPNNYGIVKWMEQDKAVLIYDKYDVWKVDPTGKEKSTSLTNGRKDKVEYRYVTVDNEEKFVKEGQTLHFNRFNEETKKSDFVIKDIIENKNITRVNVEVDNFSKGLLKAKGSEQYIYQDESYKTSSDLFTFSLQAVDVPNNISRSYFVNSDKTNYFFYSTKISSLNPQQANYNWGTAELFKWQAYTGKQTEGIVYKPENFDPKKKYPMIVYFYERNNQTLHNYRSPAPTASALNIPFFVSNGYVVFVPDIWYTTGKPGKSAYDYIVSGTRALVKQGFVDSTKIGLQGQSWGGYQIAYLITQTNLYKAAWAGAPVANMFSAYGGIRWGSGLNRQFQYEHSQSRIGATPWEKPNLYIENSPLFHLPKVKTPLVIMHNDADDAVPWYQGIELFTALRRLSKPVWMLNYNNELHNLMERKNRKDIQIKQQQFFDYMLKDAPPAKWISEGIPAIMKGRVQ
jgi:dienelactone hydrolase